MPDHLRDLFIDAPYQAASRVFDAAISERVDFVVLAGDILHPPTATPRAFEFLGDQLARLHEKGIGVYWLGGQLETGHRWPEELTLPENVHRYPASRLKTYTVRRQDETLATIVGQSAAGSDRVSMSDYRGGRDGYFRIALVYGDLAPKSLAKQDVDYWALGGGHNSRCLKSTATAHYCGTPQGRRPGENGPHGCLLVEVEDMQAKPHLLETDVQRFLTERIEISTGTTRSELEALFKERTQLLQSTNSDTGLLVTWQIEGDGPLGYDLRQGELREQLLKWLRQEAGAASKRVWTVDIQSQPGTLPAELFEEDTILGDFLRTIRQFEENDDSAFDVEEYLPSDAAKKLVEKLQLNSKAERREVLRQVATLGIDLLRGDRSGSPT